MNVENKDETGPQDEAFEELKMRWSMHEQEKKSMQEYVHDKLNLTIDDKMDKCSRRHISSNTMEK
jgi:hypothetical protein